MMDVMASEANRKTKYQLSTSGVMVYVALWAIIFAVVNVLRKYSSAGATDSFPDADLVLIFVIPLATGLVFVAVGVAIAYSTGNINRFRAVAAWCFVIGCLLLPLLAFVLAILAGPGGLFLN